MLKFNILTLFPEVFPGILQHGLLGKALSKNHFEINTINIRDYSDLSANSVDDKPFSGGAGMVLRPDIISKSIEANFNKNELDFQYVPNEPPHEGNDVAPTFDGIFKRFSISKVI